jgi:hypothetical protein
MEAAAQRLPRRRQQAFRSALAVRVSTAGKRSQLIRPHTTVRARGREPSSSLAVAANGQLHLHLLRLGSLLSPSPRRMQRKASDREGKGVGTLAGTKAATPRGPVPASRQDNRRWLCRRPCREREYLIRRAAELSLVLETPLLLVRCFRVFCPWFRSKVYGSVLLFVLAGHRLRTAA